MPVLAAIVPIILRMVIMRVIFAFGIGLTVYKISDWGIDKMKEYFYHGYHSLPVVILDLLNIGGFELGIEILFSCIAFRAALISAKSIAYMTFGGS